MIGILGTIQILGSMWLVHSSMKSQIKHEREVLHSSEIKIERLRKFGIACLCVHLIALGVMIGLHLCEMLP